MRDLNRPTTPTMRRPSAAAQTVVSRERESTETDTPPAAAAHVLRSDALLQGRSHVNIMHNGETYQLRATRLGKLILTK